MSALTSQVIADEERATAEHYEDLAAKAKKAGHTADAEDYTMLALLARRQADRALNHGELCR